MHHKLQHGYRRHKVIIWIVAGFFVLYGLAGFVAVPLGVHHLLKNQVSQMLGRNVTAASVSANPFTFAVRLTRLSISEPEDGPFIDVGELYVNVDPLVSLFKWGLAVNSIEIDKPKVRLIRTGPGQFNFSDLMHLSENQGQPETSKPSKPMRLVLHAFQLSDGEIHFKDSVPSVPFETTLSALNVATSSPLDTSPEAKAILFQLSARTEAYEAVAVDGQVDVDPFSLIADVKVNGLSLAKYASYYPSHLNAQLTGGKAGLHAKVNWSDGTQTVSEILLTLSNLALVSEQNASLVTIPWLEVEGADVDLKKKWLRLGRIRTRDGKIHLQFDTAGRLNLQTALVSGPPQSTPPDESTPEKAPANSAAWAVTVPEFALKGYTVHYQDQQTDPAANFTFSKISLNARDLSTRENTRGTADLALNWADQGILKVQGDVGLIPLQAELKMAANALDLRPAQPYINRFLQLVVTQGRLDTEGTLKIIPQNTFMDVQYTGQAALNDFKSVDPAKADGFLNWKSLYVTGLDIGTTPFRLTVNEVALTDFFNRLIINADGTSNLAMIMAGDKPSGKDKNQDVPPAVKGKKPQNKTGKPDIRIKTVTLQGGNVDFTDRLVKPNVHLNMTQIGGRIAGLDAIKENKAELLLKGMVRENVPMKISGQVNPLIEQPFADITIGLNAVDLSPFTPYSGKYLGYKLQKGQLALNLSYRVAQNKLDARNKVLLSQLTLGEPVDSPDATKLPVKLALALLKDRDGNIDIDLPVTGDLDDPEFSIGGLVVKMFINLIVEAVSSPFKLLGALFGGGEELAYVDFDAGRSDMAPERTDKLDNLSKILYERPGLNLEIQGQVNPEADVDSLRQLRFEDQLKAAKLKTRMARGRKAVPLAQIKLTPKDRSQLVKKAYDAARFPKPRDEKGKLKKLSLTEMEKLLYTAIEITADDLRLLAHRRASAVKQYLIDQGKVEKQRLFIVEPKIEGGDAKEGPQSRVKFTLN